VGKTTLGRYLAWQFNISLVELDLFLIPNQGKLVYMNEALSTSLRAGLESHGP
jgi:shikimate kinase